MSEEKKYDVITTAGKAAPPVVTVALVELARFYCRRHGIQIEADQLYQLALVLCGGFMALMNWLKNRKKK